VCRIVSELAMLGVCAIFLHGAWAQVRINADVTAPVSGLSMGIFYASGVVFAAAAAGLLLIDLGRSLRGKDGSQ
jgi:TRAP-type C4-dicarboxylate transport system permease small subunit